MLKIFLEEQVAFLLIGGISINLYGYIRSTKDMDLWVQASKENAPKIIRALAKFGTPMENVSAEDFEKEGTILRAKGVAIHPECNAEFPQMHIHVIAKRTPTSLRAEGAAIHPECNAEFPQMHIHVIASRTPTSLRNAPPRHCEPQAWQSTPNAMPRFQMCSS